MFGLLINLACETEDREALFGAVSFCLKIQFSHNNLPRFFIIRSTSPMFCYKGKIIRKQGHNVLQLFDIDLFSFQEICRPFGTSWYNFVFNFEPSLQLTNNSSHRDQ